MSADNPRGGGEPPSDSESDKEGQREDEGERQDVRRPSEDEEEDLGPAPPPSPAAPSPAPSLPSPASPAVAGGPPKLPTGHRPSTEDRVEAKRRSEALAAERKKAEEKKRAEEEAAKEEAVRNAKLTLSSSTPPKEEIAVRGRGPKPAPGQKGGTTEKQDSEGKKGDDDAALEISWKGLGRLLAGALDPVKFVQRAAGLALMVAGAAMLGRGAGAEMIKKGAEWFSNPQPTFKFSPKRQFKSSQDEEEKRKEEAVLQAEEKKDKEEEHELDMFKDRARQKYDDAELEEDPLVSQLEGVERSTVNQQKGGAGEGMSIPEGANNRPGAVTPQRDAHQAVNDGHGHLIEGAAPSPAERQAAERVAQDKPEPGASPTSSPRPGGSRGAAGG